MGKSYSKVELRFYGTQFRTRSANQADYVENVLTNFITFGVGSAGSGKTYCAVATALHFLENREVDRIILTRPAVEAGENLGFLPGELEDKIGPYLYPLYDSLDDLIGRQKREKLLEQGRVEIIPLAYMRGRTLNDAVVILDEAQNTTTSQMKMFLTRLGKHSKAIVNGDPTQNDLDQRWQQSGLADAVSRLRDIDGIGVTEFDASDVVRHKIVQKVIEAYQDD